MRIAIFSTNLFSTPPMHQKKIFAPLWVADNLVKGLLKKGHDVYLFGSSDSKTNAKLISNNLPSLAKNRKLSNIYKKLNENWKSILKESYELTLISKLFEQAKKNKFDIIQFHSKLWPLYFANLVNVPIVFTIHDSLDFPDKTGLLSIIYNRFQKTKNINFVSISNAQRKPLPNLNYAATVYNGIDTQKFSLSEKKGDYLAFAGRILPWKGAHIAAQTARKTGEKLKIAAEIPYDRMDYWNKKIKPYLSQKITYQGMLNQSQMPSFYKGAKALLMPISWEEPFGLVMIEAMACGTPVIAFNHGSVPEIVKDGKTGFIVKNSKEMVEAVKKIGQIDRLECRRWVEEKFSIGKMVDEYEKVYYKILNKK